MAMRNPSVGNRPSGRGAARAPRRGRPGMTVTELLVVMVIIAVLAALLVPAAHRAWEHYYFTQCKINLGFIYKAFYSGSHILPQPQSWTAVVHAAGAGENLICPKDEIKVVHTEEIQFRYTNIRYLNPPPPSARFNDLEHNSQVHMFKEREAFELPRDVTVDIGSPGKYGNRGLAMDFRATSTTIAAGTPVNCWFLHYDSIKRSPQITSGSVTFPEEIIGIICLDDTLDESDSILGISKYSTGQRSRGFERVEHVELTPDRHTYKIHKYRISFPGEDVRILTTPTEEEQMVSYGKYGILRADTTSYGMNVQVKSVGSRPDQILLAEYESPIIESDDPLEDFQDVFYSPDVGVAPRHHDMVNVLSVEGEVYTVTKDEIAPGKDIWEP